MPEPKSKTKPKQLHVIRAFKVPMGDDICAQVPIAMQHDFFSLMLMSKLLSSISHT